MIQKIRILTMTAVTSASALAAASPATITQLQCTLDSAATLDASIGYQDKLTGRHYDYALHITNSQAGTTRLRDGAGRVIASATTSPTTRPVFAPGPDYTPAVEATLVSVLGRPEVQGRLEACAGPAAQHPGYHPWGPVYCPILVFVWDPDLVAHLCGWPPGDPAEPHAG